MGGKRTQNGAHGRQSERQPFQKKTSPTEKKTDGDEEINLATAEELKKRENPSDGNFPKRAYKAKEKSNDTGNGDLSLVKTQEAVKGKS